MSSGRRGRARVYVVTAAQNGTPVHDKFWACLKQLARHRRARLVVVPIRYKNPTSRWTESQENAESWAPEVTEHLWSTRKTLNENLVLVADAKTQCTAPNPLGGYDSVTGASSTIVAHPKIALRCVATPSNRMAKICVTTGACTVKNYSDTKAGILGAFHHTLAALVVEVVGKKFFVRHVGYDGKSGSFTDLDTRYYPDRHVKAPRPKALVMGDTHFGVHSPEVERATFGDGGVVPTLDPEYLVWHDLFDGASVNPHHAGKPFAAVAKYKSGRNLVANEVVGACEYVREHTRRDMKSVVVCSNHNNFLKRWVDTHDWKTDPANGQFYLDLAAEMHRETGWVPGGVYTPEPLGMLFPDIVDMTNIRVLKDGEDFTLLGVDLSLHGDKGPNGSRGSAKGLRRIGVKSMIGHSHTPGIEEGCWQVGCSTFLDLDYAVGGPSSWLNCHGLLHADGKRQLIFVIDKKWRA